MIMSPFSLSDTKKICFFSSTQSAYQSLCTCGYISFVSNVLYIFLFALNKDNDMYYHHIDITGLLELPIVKCAQKLLNKAAGIFEIIRNVARSVGSCLCTKPACCLRFCYCNLG